MDMRLLRSFWPPACALLACVLPGSVAHGEEPGSAPRSALETLRTLRLPQGFVVELVAAEPDVVKPMDAVFDPRGRLWIVESIEYPWKSPPERPGRDRVVILDLGTGDKPRRQVFASNLELPTSLVLYRDGAIVCQAPDIVFLRDTDGDDAADKREVLFTGFEHPDTHATISSLTWGLDGWVYATQGYDRSRPRRAGPDGSPTGPELADFAAGAFRFRPDGSAFEVLTSTGSNTWGIGIDAGGEVFISKANGAHLNHLVIPNRYLERVAGHAGAGNVMIADHADVRPIAAEHYQIDFIGGFTAACGATPYHGAAWPAEFDGSIFVCEPTMHAVHVDRIEPRGATLVAKRLGLDEFLASTDPWFRPIDCVVGPEGALYVLDFYNQAIIHNNPLRPHDEHGPGNAWVTERDHEHGRIWRVQREGGPPFRPAQLAALFAGASELASSLSHPNFWVRETAQRLLLEKRDDARSAGALLKSTAGGSPSWQGRLHALWTLAVLGELEARDLYRAMEDPSPAVRKNAARIAPLLGARESVDLQLLCRLAAGDEDAATRREAVLALGDLPPAPATSRALARALEEAAAGGDAWMEIAVQAAVRDASDFAANVLERSKEAPPSEKVRGAFSAALRQASRAACRPGRSGVVARLIELAAKPGDASLRSACLEGLSEGMEAVGGNALPALDERVKEALLSLLSGGDERLRRLALPLASKLGTDKELAAALEPLRAAFLERLADRGAGVAQRIEAIEAVLATLPTAATVARVARVLDPGEPPELQLAAVQGIARTGINETASLLIAPWAGLSPRVRGEVLEALLSRPAWSQALLAALDEKAVPAADLPAAALYRLRNHPDAALAEKARKSLASLNRGQDGAEDREALLERLAPLVTSGGDPENGALVFGKHCAPCHLVDGKGTDIGPDLTGIGLRGAESLLLDILDPNRSIEGAFISYAVVTKKGQTLTGVIAAENAERVVLKRNGGTDVVARSEIVSLASQGISLMPEGLEKAMSLEELRDLLASLAGSSPYRALDLRPAANADGSRGLFLSYANTRESLPFPRYGSVTIGGIPFQILHPATTDGRNLIVLRGGPSEPNVLSRGYPERAEVSCGMAARAIHVLGGVGGWAYPAVRETIPVLMLTLHYGSGEPETILWKNGVEIADYNGFHEVPGSKAALRLGHRQVRMISFVPRRRESIESIELASPGGPVAPVVVAITVEK